LWYDHQVVPRYPSTTLSYSFGPGPPTPAVKALIWANIAGFLATWIAPRLTLQLGLSPAAVLEHLAVWQPATYMFLHAGLFHLVFNMLALWMFGTELERFWGTRAFIKYYAVTGLGAAATMIVLALLPFDFSTRMYGSVTVGASGAIYGLLLAYAMRFPDRPIYMYMLFPVPAKYFVMIIGAITFLLSVSDAGGGVAHVAHLGGLVVGYAYLRRRTGGLTAEIKYRYLRWKMNRMRKRFDVHTGGRGRDSDRWVH
jgi:membrane associated rhomboid family serine protease